MKTNMNQFKTYITKLGSGGTTPLISHLGGRSQQANISGSRPTE